MHHIPLSGDRKYINLETFFSLEELIFVEKKVFCASSRRISFGRKNIILERIHFVLKEINSVDKKLLCSIPGGNSFGRKFLFGKNLFCSGI